MWKGRGKPQNHGGTIEKPENELKTIGIPEKNDVKLTRKNDTYDWNLYGISWALGLDEEDEEDEEDDDDGGGGDDDDDDRKVDATWLTFGFIRDTTDIAIWCRKG